MSYNYVSVFPENVKERYTEYDSIDFVMTFENQALVPNSVRIKADLDVYKTSVQANQKDQTRANLDFGVVYTNNGAVRNADTRIKIDSAVGAHCFISSITTEMQSASSGSGGTIENFQEYPRYCRMVADTTMRPNDTNSAAALCELRAPSDEIASNFLQGCLSNRGGSGSPAVTSQAAAPADVIPTRAQANVDASTKFRPNDFSIQPRFCLNNMSGPLNYAKSGAIRVNIKLSRNANALYQDQNYVIPDAAYVLSNVRLCYQTMAPAKNAPVQLNTKLNIKQSVLSSFSNVSTKVPAVCNAVSCSFQQQSHENSINFNSTETEKLPNLDRLQFLFNDSQNAFVTFEIKDRVETLKRYIESFANTGLNNCSLRNLMHNRSYGVGLSFGEFIDLSNQKFNVQLSSGVNSNDPYTLYMYFHSMSSI